MSWETIKQLGDKEFRRLSGVKRQTFEKMVEVLSAAREAKRVRGGRRPKLRIEETLLMTLEYWREYRTYFHISKSYGISEGYAYKLIRWVEDLLKKHPDFALPGKKELLKSDAEYEVVLIDATESPIERPKKSKKPIIQGKRRDTQ